MAEPNPLPEEQQPAAETEVVRPSRRRGILLALIAVAVVVAIGFWWRSTFSEDTDDAQINGHLIEVSARVSGHVKNVYVKENETVSRGALIAELDPSDFQVAVARAQGALASAEAAAAAANVKVPITTVNTGSNLSSANADVAAAQAGLSQAEQQLDASRARVAQAQANYTKAESDLDRYKPLVQKDVISKQQYDAAVAEADAGKAAVADAQATQKAAADAVNAAREKLNQAQAMEQYAKTGPKQVLAESARARQAEAQVKEAQAALDQAKLNLGYTKIYAPVTGIITKKSVEVDENVSAGQNLLTLVSLEDLWVTANFKETQLEHMRAGQSVDIHVDATDKTYKGRVTQIGGATGSVLSLFPPENATGNYVKVVQRVPVRVDFTNLANEDRNHVLRPGFSVEPKVWVK
ncbi:MAG TPA: HlyD family secretion protein [Terracidiphilus sp.]